MDHRPTTWIHLLLALSLLATNCLGAQDAVPKDSNETVAAPSEPPVPLATRLARARAQAKALATPNPSGYLETPSQPDIRPGGSLSENLWYGRVALPQADQDTQTSAALRHLIRQVRSMKFEDKTPHPTFTPPAGPQPVDVANVAPPTGIETPGPASTPAGPAVATATSSASPTTLPPTAQKTLNMLRQDPTQVRDPLEMAELLFLSGQSREAAPFYAKALERLHTGEPNYDADRAWILFQLGNCLRESDIAQAQEVYMKLVSDYPASPWTELAKAHGQLLTWYRKDRPDQLTTSPRL